jgi:hypothetical protein
MMAGAQNKICNKTKTAAHQHISTSAHQHISVTMREVVRIVTIPSTSKCVVVDRKLI